MKNKIKYTLLALFGWIEQMISTLHFVFGSGANFVREIVFLQPFNPKKTNKPIHIFRLYLIYHVGSRVERYSSRVTGWSLFSRRLSLPLLGETIYF